MAIRADAGFSLADQLFNAESVGQLTKALKQAHPTFRSQRYQRRALSAFPELELKARISWLSSALDEELPRDFNQALGILHNTLPEPLDPTRQDGDFGHFIWAVLGDYVARHGCASDRLSASLTFLAELTKRFSAEFAIRPFLQAHPEETLRAIHTWATADHYHVRRLASEGIRPYLPWAQRVLIPAREIVAVLELLHADDTRFVTRSVANTLNDISRTDPDLVIATLIRWHELKRQDAAELAWMTRHALRTLSKQGNRGALKMLGYPHNPKVARVSFDVPGYVKVGDTLNCSATFISQRAQRLKVLLRIGFLKANGALADKVFALKDVQATANETISLSKSISFRPMTTRSLYPGEHQIELIANGKTIASADFVLKGHSD